MDKEPKISEPEVIIIHCDEDGPQLVPKKNTKNTKKQKKKRKVQIDSTDNERLIITKKVKKQEFKCIINLTNICDHEHKTKVCLESFENKKNKKKSEYLRSNSILERVPPRCMRKCCQSKTSKCCSTQSKKRSRKRENLKNCTVHKKNLSNRILISPVSFIDLSEEMSSISYENISSDNLIIESDNDLDTLIKRTKDREKQLIMALDNSSPRRGSPLIEISSEEDYIQCIDNASIDSVATLMLEPHSEIYSPTNPTLSPAQNYSPTQSICSPNKCDRKHEYCNPINMKPDIYTNNIRDIALQNYTVQGVDAKINVCMKKEPYAPVIIPTYKEYFAIDNSFMQTPKCDVLSPTKSNYKKFPFISK